MSTYAGDIFLLVSDASEVEMVGSILEEYGSAAGIKISANKSVGFPLGTWGSRSMPSDGLVGFWTGVLVKLVGICFGPGLQEDTNWKEVTNRVTSIQ